MELTFLLLLIAFLSHEIDAFFKFEWRLLYVFRSMPDTTARQAFAYAHIPLVLAILWLAYWASAPLVAITRIALAIFAIVHAYLHFRLRNHPQYKFNSFSHLLIVLTAAFGGMYLLLAARSAA